MVLWLCIFHLLCGATVCMAFPYVTPINGTPYVAVSCSRKSSGIKVISIGHCCLVNLSLCLVPWSAVSPADEAHNTRGRKSNLSISLCTARCLVSGTVYLSCFVRSIGNAIRAAHPVKRIAIVKSLSTLGYSLSKFRDTILTAPVASLLVANSLTVYQCGKSAVNTSLFNLPVRRRNKKRFTLTWIPKIAEWSRRQSAAAHVARGLGSGSLRGEGLAPQEMSLTPANTQDILVAEIRPSKHFLFRCKVLSLHYQLLTLSQFCFCRKIWFVQYLLLLKDLFRLPTKRSISTKE